MAEEIYLVSSHPSPAPFYITIAGRSYCDGSYHITRSHSAVFCMEYIYEGSGTVQCDGKRMTAEKNDIYMLPIGSEHDYYSSADNPWKKIWFNAAGPLIENLLHAYRFDGTPVFRDAGLREYFEKIVALCASSGNPSDINAACALIFHELLQKLYESTHEQNTLYSPEAERMKEHLDTHLNENVSADALAALIYKSRSQAIRIFKKEFGTTPYDYLLNNRILQAKTLLRNTNLLVKEIAYRIGFTDEHYFSDFFKRKCGVTPREYRDKR